MGRRIVITGGGTGIGLATARRFLAESPSLVLIGRRPEVLASAADELRTGHPDADVTTAPCDLIDPDAVDALAAQLREGPAVDVLICAAGGNYGLGAKTLDELRDAWRKDFDGNVITALLLTEALKPHLARPGGRIVGVSSVAGIRGSYSYGAAKAAMNAWMWSLATELAPQGITVNTVAPGFVPETPFWQPRLAADPALWESRVKPIPAGRPGTAAEIAEAIAYLASPDAGWTTGQILQVNGGTVLGRG